MTEFPTFDLATVGKGQALHAVDGDAVACGAVGVLGNYEIGVDARAVRVKGRSVCENCRTVIANRSSTERRPTPDAATSADGQSGRSRRPERRESSMAAQTGDKKRRSASRAPSRARSAAAPAAEQTEKGTAILSAFKKALEREVGPVEYLPNASGTNVRILVDGKSFGEHQPPRAASLHVKIPRHVAHVEKSLPKGHGFKASATGWGLTRTLTSAADAAVVAKAFKVAADAVRPKVEEQEAAAS